MHFSTSHVQLFDNFVFFQEKNPSNANTRAATEDLRTHQTAKNTRMSTPQISLTTAACRDVISPTLILPPSVNI